ncbi:AMP-dependent synthetase [Nocardiopsis sp. TSRI0078]|uniref:TIGR03089 family protein n=1 Tax=unclassified Nocardiopsis TaxID=2649073 RepID=UPI00093B4CA5|nr:TIGR03089 family protein [Nocardiopsis sp. TSRI0078]OKI15318.1 AMP-dependent synthetase [Nocardiopsis sp. TSRI0078]
MSETPAQLWRALVSADPSRPFVTSYDASGGRVELSRTTFDNWVSKTSNMLVDGLGAQPGDRVVIALPVHWQSLVWLLSCWSVGAVAEFVRPDADPPEGAQVAVAGADRLEAALDSGADEVVGTSLHPLGLPLAEVPPMVLDYSVEVRGYGDHFSPYPIDPEAPALDGHGPRTGAALAAGARHLADRWKLTAEDRVGLFAEPDAPMTVLGEGVELLLAPVAAGSPVVLTPLESAGPEESLRRAGMEKVTVAVRGPGGPPFPDGFPFRTVELT